MTTRDVSPSASWEEELRLGRLQEHAAALFVGAALAAREMIRGALYTVLHALEDPFDDSDN